MMSRPLRLLCLWGASLCGFATLPAATFGTAVPVRGAPLDLVLDERRNQLYLVDYGSNAVQVYSIGGRRLLAPIPVGAQPVGAALSLDGKFLYVTSYGASALNVVDLDQNAVVRTVATPAPPEGVAVGLDGRVVITTLGRGAAATPTDTLVIFDPDSRSTSPITSVAVPPAPPALPTLPATNGRIYLSFHARLEPTPDRRFLIGMNTPTNNSTIVFVYEVASGTVLRLRSVPGLSTVLSVSPDGNRFMAGLYLFDTATLNVLAQTSTANAPFTAPANFNAAQNVGGSAFTPDGQTLYSAFNVAPLTTPTPRSNSATLLVSNPRNLGIQMGLQLPESILGKMVAASDGSNVYALSESGLLVLPVGALNTFPILAPETTVVRLTASQCDRSQATASLALTNAGRGALRYSTAAVAATAGLSMQGGTGQAPGRLAFAMNPATTRQLGSTLTVVTLQSAEAINIPPTILVYQNWRNAETQSTTYALEVSPTVTEGAADIVFDSRRQRIYIANSGKNRLEVFDVKQQAFLASIEVGQLPHSLAFSPDGRTLYVANTGGESVSLVDLEAGRQYDRIAFPAAPFNATTGPATPRAIAQGIYGLQMFVAPAAVGANQTGQLWSVSEKLAVMRPLSSAIGTLNVPGPATMVSAPGNDSIILLAGNGTAYLYDSLADDYVVSRTVMTAPITSYYGVVGAGPGGSYFLANRAILNAALVPTGGFSGGTTVTPPGGGGAGGAGGFGGGGAGGGGAGGGVVFPFPFPFPIPTPGGGAAGGGGGVAATPATLRNVPAVAPINATTYARVSLPPQTNANSAPTGDARLMVEVVNVNTEQTLAVAQLSEGAFQAAVGNARVNVPGRLMAVDDQSMNAYVLTASGLSVAALSFRGAPIAVNPRGVVNAATYQTAVAPGGLISIFGQNMADSAVAGSLPLPGILGGACVTVNDTGLPLIMASPNQINAQLPPDLRTGSYSLVVRSTRGPSASASVPVSVIAAAPGVFANPSTGEAALFHSEDFSLVTQDNPASRDEALVLFATGLPAAAGVRLVAGQASPTSPLATTVTPKVFVGDPTIRESEMIVEWSGFTPGFVGLNQINLRVRGDRVRGDRLPVSIQAGNASSPTSGPLVPVSYVH